MFGKNIKLPEKNKAVYVFENKKKVILITIIYVKCKCINVSRNYRIVLRASSQHVVIKWREVKVSNKICSNMRIDLFCY